MLSKDELANGKTFLLRLWNREGVSSQWVQILCDDIARHWYDIYRFSKWSDLRLGALDVFQTPATEEIAAAVLKAGKCLYIHTREIAVEDLYRDPLH